MLRRFTVLAVVAFALASPALAAAACRTISGTFTAVPPATCSSPVNICTHGTLAGSFPSTYDFVVDTLTPVVAVPGAFTYTGHDTITAGSTVLTGKDYGAMYFVGPTTAKFVTTVKIVGGGRVGSSLRERSTPRPARRPARTSVSSAPS